MTALGAVVRAESTRFAVRSPHADAVWLCLFSESGESSHVMQREGPDWVLELPGNLAGTRYGYRAAG